MVLKPVAFHSDKHGIFRVNRKDSTGEELTRFGRALSELNIDFLCADTPQAKGRVERAFGTLQDRLVFRDNQKVCSATISDTPISGIFFL